MSEYQKENKILFNRKKLRRSRVRAMNYDIPNFIYEHTAQDLTSRLDEINREFKSILILTKNKNFISTKSLTKKIKDPLIVSPISLSNKKAIMIEDEEYLPFQENSFDLILSDLMLHASNNLKSSLEKIHALLKPDGLMAFQGITYHEQGFEDHLNQVDFIKKYIFPGSNLISVNHVLSTIKEFTDLSMVHLEDITKHYAQTLKLWRKKYMSALPSIKGMGFSDEFLRIWEYYFIYCEAGFRERYIGDVQIVMAKPEKKDIQINY